MRRRGNTYRTIRLGTPRAPYGSELRPCLRACNLLLPDASRRTCSLPGPSKLPYRKRLRPCLHFLFAAIDVTAYPYAFAPDPAPWQQALKSWSTEERVMLLAATGQERLRQKAEALGQALHDRDRDQVL